MHVRIFRITASFVGSMVYGGNAGNKNVTDKNGGSVTLRQRRAEMAQRWKK